MKTVIDGLFDDVHGWLYVPGCRLRPFRGTDSSNSNIRNTVPFSWRYAVIARAPCKCRAVHKVLYMCTCMCSECILVPYVSLPFLLRDGSGYCVHSTGMVWVARDVPSEDGPHQVERENDKQTDAGNSQLQGTLTQNSTHGIPPHP